jgi:hypothetical protein
MTPFALSTTLIRIVVPFLATLGGAAGAFIGVVKLMPERAKLIVGYQLEAIEDLREENERLISMIERLETRVRQLEDEPARWLA